MPLSYVFDSVVEDGSLQPWTPVIRLRPVNAPDVCRPSVTKKRERAEASSRRCLETSFEEDHDDVHVSDNLHSRGIQHAS